MIEIDPNSIIPKSLFLPLNGEHYDSFDNGLKDTEYRLHGKRWNLKTCYPGRKIVLSRGYGKQNRRDGVIEEVIIYALLNMDSQLRGRLWALLNPGSYSAEIICIKIKLEEKSV